MAASRKNAEIIAEVKQSNVPVPWCDEFEKMISGMSFSASRAPNLQDYKLNVRRKLNGFNDATIPETATIASLTARRMSLAEEFCGKLGEGVNIEPPFFLIWGCNTFIGPRVYMNREVSIHDNAPVFIGENTLIGPDVCICTGTHDLSVQARQQAAGTSFALPIWIEADCWIGMRATILPGVRIGRGATVAAGAVVCQDVEPGTLVGGVPAKLIRRLGGSGGV